MPRSGQTRVARSSWRRTLITWRNTAHPSGSSSTLRYIEPSYQSCDPTEILHSYPRWVSIGWWYPWGSSVSTPRTSLQNGHGCLSYSLPSSYQSHGNWKGGKPSLISRPALRTNVFSLSHAHMQRSTRVWSFKLQFKNTPVRSSTSTALEESLCWQQTLLNVTDWIQGIVCLSKQWYDYCKMWG